MKRNLILTAALIAAIPVMADIDFSYTYGDHTIKYTITGEDAEFCKTKSGSSSSGPNKNLQGDLIIPPEVEYNGKKYPVRTIGSYSFQNNTGLTSVTISEGVTSFEVEPFGKCSSLKEVHLPESLKEIMIGGFGYCSSLEYINLPKDLATIPAYCFNGCTSLEEITIPEGIVELKGSTFLGCTSLKRVNLPSTIKKFYASEFGNCASLETIILPVSLENSGKNLFQGCSSLKEVVFPPNFKYLEVDMFKDCPSMRKIALPDRITKNEPEDFTVVKYPASVTEYDPRGVIISDNTLCFMSIYAEGGYTVPEKISAIGNGAFAGCDNISSVGFHEEISKIGSDAFLGCSSLTSIRLPNRLELIENGTFKSCTALENVYLGSGLTSIGEYAFSGCVSLDGIVVPPSVVEIGTGAYQDCGLSTLEMGHSVAKLGENVFAGNNLSRIAVTAQLPPDAHETAFDDFSAGLLLQGAETLGAYASQDCFWSGFSGEEMVVAQRIDSDDSDIITLQPGETLQLRASVYPGHSTLPHIFWVSTNPDVASVDSRGVVTMKSVAIARTRAEDSQCAIIARTMYADGPVREFAVNDTPTGVTENCADGLDKFDIENLPTGAEIFTLSGMNVTAQAKQLNAGMYIVRYKNSVYKL
ncbi:MAG: leucine-rich repeat protein, partial [Muribaculaceae bacterium]|nr:leucine-rich repeat protein [Muribaculaceae bacterium]